MPKQAKEKAHKKGKRNFSSFTLKEAMQLLGIERLHDWQIEAAPRKASDFFHERLRRLVSTFDTERTERSKELLVDAYCEEVLIDYPILKFWKSAPLSSDDLTGIVDYLLTKQRGYIDKPLLCIMEAKKDDFEQGLTQSLVEMYACRQVNQQAGIERILYAIVTNGDGWQFYRYEEGQIYRTVLYTTGDQEKLLGMLEKVFALCSTGVQ